MPEDPIRPPFLMDALRLAVQVDGFLLDGESFQIEKALELRHQLYDLLKRVKTFPVNEHTEGLAQIVARAFAALQSRLTLGNT